MSENEIADQTAFETAGIPTPPDQENIGATDQISDAVEAMMDNIEDSFTIAEEEADDQN